MFPRLGHTREATRCSHKYLESVRKTRERPGTPSGHSEILPTSPPPPPPCLEHKNRQKITQSKHTLKHHHWISKKYVLSVTGIWLGQIDEFTLINDFRRFLESNPLPVYDPLYLKYSWASRHWSQEKRDQKLNIFSSRFLLLSYMYCLWLKRKIFLVLIVSFLFFGLCFFSLSSG